MTAGQLIGEFVLNLMEALLAALLLAWAAGLRSYRARVGFVTVAGILAALMTNMQYWIWYGFPANYTAAYILNQVVGFFLIGLVIAPIVKSKSTVTALPVERAA